MLTLHSTSVISTAVVAVAAIIFSATFHVVLAQAPSLSPFSSPEPLTPLSPSPSTMPTNDCLTPVLNMSDCLSYVQKPPTATVPDKNCCPELAGLIDSNPICLCQLLSNTSLTESYGIKVDVNRALKLPSVCKIQTPPVSMCSAVGYPVPGPMASVIPESPSPAVSPVPMSSGVEAPVGLASSPTAGNNGNGATKIGGSAKEFFIIGLPFSFLLTTLI